MEQYIDKAEVKAWLEKRKIPFKKDIDNGVYPTYLCALMDFEDFIDTLEVKEEILDSNDIKEAFKSGYDMGVIQTTKKMNSNTKRVDLDLEITLWANAIPEIQLDDVERLAKHFFELGIKTQKGE